MEKPLMIRSLPRSIRVALLALALPAVVGGLWGPTAARAAAVEVTREGRMLERIDFPDGLPAIGADKLRRERVRQIWAEVEAQGNFEPLASRDLQREGKRMLFSMSPPRRVIDPDGGEWVDVWVRKLEEPLEGTTAEPKPFNTALRMLLRCEPALRVDAALVQLDSRAVVPYYGSARSFDRAQMARGWIDPAVYRRVCGQPLAGAGRANAASEPASEAVPSPGTAAASSVRSSAAAVASDRLARLRLVATHGMGVRFYKRAACIGGGPEVRIASRVSRSMALVLGLPDNLSLGMPESEFSRAAADRNRVGNRNYFQEFEIAAGEPLTVVIENGRCPATAMSFTPRGSVDYEARFEPAANGRACGVVIGRIQGDASVREVRMTPAAACNAASEPSDR
ncbi:hypothetical protein [Roseateles amylovorans]|uniref:Uncharacterized protein n=1 Tax=Roseateles amylovorans TaxID=2978473 RepID=A0ABY6B346_9BURK|nr:hypothetical protein [Roseateles amylovorans]UXH79600.1 hypothetical protein N4261_06690 [Roseateles amylovorans]